jgi:hypothetical protein
LNERAAASLWRLRLGLEGDVASRLEERS